MTTSFWPHQQDAYDWALDKRAAYLAMAMGTGKSAIAVRLHEDRGHKRTLILAPKAVVGGWPNQFATHGSGEPVVCALDDGPIAKRVTKAKDALAYAEVHDRSFVCVMNYEAVPQPAMKDWIAKVGFDFVVCDEAHKIKAHGGLISKTIWRLFRGKDIHRLALSGTPLPHSPLDAFAQYRWLDERIFTTSFVSFRARYAMLAPMIPKVIAWLNQDELAAKMETIMLRVDRDVLDLLPSQHIVRNVRLGPKAMRAHADLSKDFYAAVEAGEITAANAIVRLLRMQQCTSGAVKLDDGTILEIDTAKAEMLEQILDELPSDERVVVFGRFIHDLDVAARVADRLGRRYGEVSGRRNDLVGSKFPPDCDVLGAQLQAGGVGVDFSSAAYCVYLSPGLSLGDFEQSLSRTDRPGQTRSVTYLHVVGENTVDEKVYQALSSKKEVVQAILETIARTHPPTA
jgi:SNF2 family DNA or RNA helicase